MKKMTALTAMAAVALAGSAMADSYSVDIDNTADSSGTIADHTFALPAIDSIDSISMELATTWGGDFEITLEHVGSGSVFDLMFDDVDQGGSGNFDMGLVSGDGTLGNVAEYTFVETGGLTVFDDTSGVAPGGTYDANVWIGGSFAASDWRLLIVDDAGGDLSSTGNVTVNYSVPAPGALALLGIAGLAGRRRRG